jgi:hypothetical protein
MKYPYTHLQNEEEQTKNQNVPHSIQSNLGNQYMHLKKSICNNMKYNIQSMKNNISKEGWHSKNVSHDYGQGDRQDTKQKQDRAQGKAQTGC